MRNTSCLALFLVSGCGAFSSNWEGVWFVEAPVMDASACVVSGDENFDNADLREDDGDTTGPWTYLGESTVSGSAFFVEVLAGKGGEVFVVLGNEVYPGIAEKKLLQVEWTSSDDSWFSEEHEAGYFYSQASVSEVLEKLTFVDPKAGQATGTLQITSTAVNEWYEADRWRLEDVPFAYTRVPSDSWLVGDARINDLGSLECADDDCHLQITTSCDGQVDLAASFAGKNDGNFSGIEDAGQDPGGTITTF